MQVAQYIEALHTTLRNAADGENAKAMAAYMKGNFPFLGIKAEKRRELANATLKINSLTPHEKRAAVLQLWSLDEREYHLVAIDILASINSKDLIESDLKLAKQLISTNSWWDSVDAIASNFVGRLIIKFQVLRDEVIEKWLNSGNLWLRRTCLIFQLKYGAKTDFHLLSSLIVQLQNDRAFFIQKAIGWSLRQYSKTNPQAVREFLNSSNLTGLALREASKYC